MTRILSATNLVCSKFCSMCLSCLLCVLEIDMQSIQHVHHDLTCRVCTSPPVSWQSIASEPDHQCLASRMLSPCLIQHGLQHCKQLTTTCWVLSCNLMLPCLTRTPCLQDFLDSTSSQLTEHGLCSLQQGLRPNELAVFFRNNHFNTLFLHKGVLHILVTDQGYEYEKVRFPANTLQVN